MYIKHTPIANGPFNLQSTRLPTRHECIGSLVYECTDTPSLLSLP